MAPARQAHATGFFTRKTIMGSLPILEKSQKRRACLENHNLPANYMSDHTVLGLVVDRLEAALQILKASKFEVLQNPLGFEIISDGAVRMAQMIDLLHQNGIDSTLADIVDQVYQG